MTDTKPIYIRAGEATRQKLDELTKLYGSQTQVFAVAIDRLYQAEVVARAAALQPSGVGEGERCS